MAEKTPLQRMQDLVDKASEKLNALNQKIKDFSPWKGLSPTTGNSLSLDEEEKLFFKERTPTQIKQALFSLSNTNNFSDADKETIQSFSQALQSIGIRIEKVETVPEIGISNALYLENSTGFIKTWNGVDYDTHGGDQLTYDKLITALGFTPLNANQKGSPNGVAETDQNNIILPQHLPSYVDDVLEGTYVNSTTFNNDSVTPSPYTPESGKIYIDKPTGKQYRWTGSIYSQLNGGLVLGETAQTAYRGDRGKQAYEHISKTDNPHNVTAAQVGAEPALGYTPANDSEVVKTVRINGVTYNRDANGLVDLGTIQNGTSYTPPPDYADKAALLADQANQVNGEEYTMLNANGWNDPEQDAITHNGWATVKYLGTTAGTEADYDLREQFDVDAPGTGSGIIQILPEITSANYDFTSSDHGIDKLRDFNSQLDQQAKILPEIFTKGQIINVWRRGLGELEFTKGTGVKIRGIRNEDNRYFVNDTESPASILCEGNDVFRVFGNMRRGGVAPSITSYSSQTIYEGQSKSFTLNGKGFSENMTVSIENGTLDNFTYNSFSEIIVDITATGTNAESIIINIDNGEEYSSSVISIEEAPTVTFLYDEYPFDTGFALFKLKESQTYSRRIRRSSDNAQVDVGFDSNHKVSVNSPVSSGGDLATWAGNDTVHTVTKYNQGSSSINLTQSDPVKQPKFMESGVIVAADGVAMEDYDGSNDSMESVSATNWAAQPYTMFTMVRNRSFNYGAIMTVWSAAKTHFQFRTGNTGVIQLLANNANGDSANNGSLVQKTSGGISANTNYKIAAYVNDTEQDIIINGVSSGAVTSPSSYPQGNEKMYDGIYPAGPTYRLNGNLGYQIFYRGDQSTNIADIEAKISELL